MTYRQDVARGRHIVARWCDLAERRLEYLTELSETGRWRRFHSEPDFLENIREARTAVATWRDLLTREASRDNSAVDMSWLDRARPTLTPADQLRDQLRRLQPQANPAPPQAPRRDAPAARIVDLFSDQALAARKPSPSSAPTTALERAANDVGGARIATIQRYPSLRHSL
jgi:uncharacterized repeat protein (TIGR03809 family)